MALHVFNEIILQNQNLSRMLDGGVSFVHDKCEKYL